MCTAGNCLDREQELLSLKIYKDVEKSVSILYNEL